MGQREAKQHSHHGNTRMRKEEQGIENLFEEIVTEKFPNLREKRHTSPGSTQSPKQDESKRPTPRHIIKWQRLKTKRES